MKYILAVALLMSTPATAETWATAKCTTQSGTMIDYILHDGKGFISYNKNKPEPMFSRRENNFGIIVHIGATGNMTMAVDLTSGRGYVIAKFDDGTSSEQNVACQLGTIER